MLATGNTIPALRLRCGKKVVDPQLSSQVCGRIDFVVFKRDAGGIGNADHGIENRDDGRAIHECRCTQRVRHVLADWRDIRTRIENRFDKSNQPSGIWNAAALDRLAIDAAKIIGVARMLTAPPEQHHVARRSIKALIQH